EEDRRTAPVQVGGDLVPARQRVGPRMRPVREPRVEPIGRDFLEAVHDPVGAALAKLDRAVGPVDTQYEAEPARTAGFDARDRVLRDERGLGPLVSEELETREKDVRLGLSAEAEPF